MGLNAAALTADVFTGGFGGGLAVRATGWAARAGRLGRGVARGAILVDRANIAVTTAQAGFSTYDAVGHGDYTRAGLSFLQMGFGLAAGSGRAPGAMGRLSVPSLGARAMLRRPFEWAGRLTGLPFRQRLTSRIRFGRSFVTPTRRHIPVEETLIGRLLKSTPIIRKLDWEQGHVFLQRRWWRAGGPTQWYPANPAANLGMRRFGNAGMNLMPMPRAVNQFLNVHPWAAAGFGAATAAAIPAAGYGGYELGTYLNEFLEDSDGSDD